MGVHGPMKRQECVSRGPFDFCHCVITVRVPLHGVLAHEM